MILHEDYQTKTSGDYSVGNAIMLGMRYYPTKNPRKGFYGRVAVLFVLTSTTNESELLYVQVLMDIETVDELKYITYHPTNIENFDPTFKKENFDEIIKGATPGENSYGSNMEFKHAILTNNGYTFDCVYSDKVKEIDYIRKVICTQAVYLQMSQFLFWLQCCYPIATDIFFDTKYNNAKCFEVTSMLFDGSTQTVFAGEKRVMAHFTLYYKDSLGATGQFGFNVPCEILKDKIERKPLLEADYIRFYGKDDTILADRIFNVATPKKKSYLLTGLPNEGFYRFYTLDEEAITKTKWLDWGKFIYLSASERILK